MSSVRCKLATYHEIFVMSKIIKSKYKISRRLGVNLWGRAKDAFNKKNYAPGQHVMKMGKKTVHGVQLDAKQKLRGYYNIGEKQFKNIYLKARSGKGNTNANLIALLEKRLDSIVYRLNLAPTVFSARQLVSHKHIMVNGKTVNIPSYVVREQDVIELKADAQQMPLCIESITKMERPIPAYLSFDPAAMRGELVNTPALADVPYPNIMEPHLVIEFYSK